MSVRVIGLGFGRTGTSSLREALGVLGITPVYHMSEWRDRPEHDEYWLGRLRGDPIDWAELFADYEGIVDWPAVGYWRELIDTFREAKCILTVRDPAAWHASVMKTIYPTIRAGLTSDRPRRQRMSEHNTSLILDGIFSGKAADASHAISVYEAHNRAVQQAVPADRLLIYDVSEGWEPLANFLGVEPPEPAFPHRNDAREFKKRQEQWDASPKSG